MYKAVDWLMSGFVMYKAVDWLMTVFVLSASVFPPGATSMASATGIGAKPKLIYRVICPDNALLRETITARAEEEDFIVECSNPMPSEELRGTVDHSQGPNMKGNLYLRH